MSTALAIREVTNSVAIEIRSFVSARQLQLPADYSVENALKAAELLLPEIKNINKIPVLQSCSLNSIKAALRSMCIQGLSPDKKQCYFIPYGETLTLQRSYFGSISVAKRVSVREIDEIYADVVYKGDVFEYEKKRGVTTISQHKQKLENINKSNIIAAYAVVLYKDGGEASTVMNMEDIKQAWKQSPMKPVDDKGVLKPDSTHAKFTAEMCKKTVINKACKQIIYSSSDKKLFVSFAQSSDDDVAAAEVEAEISENANKETLDVDFLEVSPECDPETGEVVKDPPVPYAHEESEPF
jgi:recombination protein RecT